MSARPQLLRTMPEQSVIVWDLETIPDLTAARRLFDLGDASDAEVREALGSGFPKHPLHKIACIGALVASRQAEGWRIDALGAPHTGERSEAQLIRDFIEKIGLAIDASYRPGSRGRRHHLDRPRP